MLPEAKARAPSKRWKKSCSNKLRCILLPLIPSLLPNLPDIQLKYPKRMRYLFILSFLALALYSCQDASDSQSKTTNGNAAEADPMPAHSVAPAEAGLQPPYPIADSSKFFEVEGVKVYVIEEGTGAFPRPESNVLIHYHGMLLDGTVFDSSVERKQPADFPLGRLIRAWQVALPKVHIGSKVKLVVPPEMGYGAQGNGDNIPPNSILVFDIELISSY
ncbi:MAG: FKBP-type peptidyl-prolyl cis-trans isomerase [Bacteroidetes bacterium]|nr:MAG: FKBP-type peptidyl-prolyl cis-trans isomerase [Bacteroidota bacterium]